MQEILNFRCAHPLENIQGQEGVHDGSLLGKKDQQSSLNNAHQCGLVDRWYDLRLALRYDEYIDRTCSL